MRTISADALAALNSGRFGVRALVKIIPGGDDEPLCFWDDVGNIAVGGDVYHGAAGRFAIEASTSASDLSIRNLNVTFSGLDSTIIGMIDGVQWHQQPILVQRAVFAIDTPQLLNLVPEYSGFIDQLIWNEGADGSPSTLVLQCESASREYSRSGSRTASDADQRERDSDDGFFAAAANAVSQSIDWGRNPEKAQKQSGGFLSKIFG